MKAVHTQVSKGGLARAYAGLDVLLASALVTMHTTTTPRVVAYLRSFFIHAAYRRVFTAVVRLGRDAAYEEVL